jgi:hypothetical protein
MGGSRGNGTGPGTGEPAGGEGGARDRVLVIGFQPSFAHVQTAPQR